MSEQTPVEEPADTVEAEFLEDPSFEGLLHFLRVRGCFDFTGYKRPSLMRRVRHRMREIGIDSFEDYQDVLQLEPREFTATKLARPATPSAKRVGCSSPIANGTSTWSTAVTSSPRTYDAA